MRPKRRADLSDASGACSLGQRLHSTPTSTRTEPAVGWVAITSGNQWQSVAITERQPVAASGNQWHSVAISGNQWQSVAITFGHVHRKALRVCVGLPSRRIVPAVRARAKGVGTRQAAEEEKTGQAVVDERRGEGRWLCGLSTSSCTACVWLRGCHTSRG